MKTALLWDAVLWMESYSGVSGWGSTASSFTVLEPQISQPVISFQKVYEIPHYKVHFAGKLFRSDDM
jgi:hypothetical protein